MARPFSLILTSALLSLALAGCIHDGEIPTETTEDGRTIGPAWSFTDTTGTEHSRDSALGSPSILFFMATWCSSCRSQTGPLANVHANHQDAGLDVYTLTFDHTETDRDLEEWKARYEQPWPHGIDPEGQIAQTFQIRAQSSLVVLDHDGLVVQIFGFPGASEPGLEQAVQAAFERQNADSDEETLSHGSMTP
jgi:peroxiredoxin